MAWTHRTAGAVDQHDDGAGVLAHRTEGVSVHSARIAGGRHGTPEELRSMESASKKAAEEVAMVEPDVIVYGCTSGSFFEGPEWNRKICEQLTAIAKAPTVTTAGAMAACLMAGGHKKVDVVTPYVELTNERLKQFAEGARHRRREARNVRYARHVRPCEDRCPTKFTARSSRSRLPTRKQCSSRARSCVHWKWWTCSNAILESRSIPPCRLRRGRRSMRSGSIRRSMNCGSLLRKLSEPDSHKLAVKHLRSA